MAELQSATTCHPHHFNDCQTPPPSAQVVTHRGLHHPNTSHLDSRSSVKMTSLPHRLTNYCLLQWLLLCEKSIWCYLSHHINDFVILMNKHKLLRRAYEIFHDVALTKPQRHILPLDSPAPVLPPPQAAHLWPHQILPAGLLTTCECELTWKKKGFLQV